MINRLYRLFLVVLLVAVSSSAFADPPVTKYRPTSQAYPATVYPLVGSTTEACNVALAEWGRSGRSNFDRAAYQTGGSCRCYQGSYFDVCGAAQPTSICLDGSAPDTSKALALQCGVAPPDCSLKTPFQFYQEADTKAAMDAMPIPSQVAWCKIDIKSLQLDDCTMVIATGKHRCYWTGVNTGELGASQNMSTAAGKEVAAEVSGKEVLSQKATSVDAKCPTGTVSGGTASDGMAICMGTGSAPKPAEVAPTKTTTPTTTTTAGDGTTTAVSTTSVKNADGSTTTTTRTTVTAPNGAVTTSESANTTAATSGSSGKADDPKDKDDLCKRNPLLNICKNSSVAGVCETISCEGDAIQCATLRAAAIMQCNQKKDRDELAASASKLLGDAIIAGNDPMKAQADLALKGTTVDLSSPNLDSSGFASSSCFPAKTFTVAGRTVVMDFATVCDKISPLRYAVIAMCTVIAYLIVSKSVLGA